MWLRLIESCWFWWNTTKNSQNHWEESWDGIRQFLVVQKWHPWYMKIMGHCTTLDDLHNWGLYGITYFFLERGWMGGGLQCHWGFDRCLFNQNRMRYFPGRHGNKFWRMWANLGLASNHCKGFNSLSMVGFKFLCVSKRGPWQRFCTERVNNFLASNGNSTSSMIIDHIIVWSLSI